MCPGAGFALLSPVTPRHPGAPDAATPRPLRAVEEYSVTEVRGQGGDRRRFLCALRSGRRDGRVVVGALVGLMDQTLIAGFHGGS